MKVSLLVSEFFLLMMLRSNISAINLVMIEVLDRDYKNKINVEIKEILLLIKIQDKSNGCYNKQIGCVILL